MKPEIKETHAREIIKMLDTLDINDKQRRNIIGISYKIISKRLKDENQTKKRKPKETHECPDCGKLHNKK